MKTWLTDEELTMYRLRGYTITTTDGTHDLFECMLDGKRHREDGPALIRPDGIMCWYQHGIPHRLDGPAVIHPSGSLEWWQAGKFHREDGPALIRPNGGMVWFQNGNLHREDGPAYVQPNSYLEWWLDSIRYQTRERWEHALEQKLENERTI